MKVLIALDSFKGSMTSTEAGEAVARGIHSVFPDAITVVSPLADGGEGSTDVILQACGGEKKTVCVQNPLGVYIDAEYGILRDQKTAVLEMAAAAGITLIPDQKRDPMLTSTYGVGEMIKNAMEGGIRNFIIGIGGSATNDGGIGMLSALGFRFLNKNGEAVSPGAAGLEEIVEIRTDHALPELAACSFSVACDVQNPLCGAHGCSAVYGPQKGADAPTVARMDAAMAHFEKVTRTVFPDADGKIPGSGAAGGLGFALITYLHATLHSGIDLIISQTHLEEKICEADIVITGEGRLDGQSGMGKAPIGVARVAKKHKKTVLAFSGCVTADAKKCNRCGIDAFFPILKAPCTLEEAMDATVAQTNLSDTTEQVFRIIQCFM